MNESVNLVLNQKDLGVGVEAILEAANRWSSGTPARRLQEEVDSLGGVQELVDKIFLQISVPNGGWTKHISITGRLSIQITQDRSLLLNVMFFGPEVANYRSIFIEAVIGILRTCLVNKADFPIRVSV